MRVLVIGGTGTIGSRVVELLFAAHHEVLVAGHTRGDYQVDLTSAHSIRALFEQTGRVGAILCCAGSAAFGPLESLTDEQFAISLQNKLMGQVNLVRLALPYVEDQGSITLTAGVFSREPMVGSSIITLVNCALEGFARAAALEMPRGIRLNVVSPPSVKETLESLGENPERGYPALDVARSYREALREGNGRTLDARILAS